MPRYEQQRKYPDARITEIGWVLVSRKIKIIDDHSFLRSLICDLPRWNINGSSILAVFMYLGARTKYPHARSLYLHARIDSPVHAPWGLV